MLTFAFLGFGYWVFVIGELVSSTYRLVVLLALERRGFKRPRFGEIRGVLTFSRSVVFSRIQWSTYSHSDVFVAGQMLGSAATGVYTFAWTIASIPVDKISSLVMQVVPPIFSAVQDDLNALRRYFLLLTEGIALASGRGEPAQ